MNGYSADLVGLRSAANRVGDLARDFAASASLKYAIVAGEVGDDELAEALAEFQHQSRHAADTLCATAAEAASRLGAIVDDYERHDRESGDSIRRELGTG